MPAVSTARGAPFSTSGPAFVPPAYTQRQRDELLSSLLDGRTACSTRSTTPPTIDQHADDTLLCMYCGASDL